VEKSEGTTSAFTETSLTFLTPSLARAHAAARCVEACKPTNSPPSLRLSEAKSSYEGFVEEDSAFGRFDFFFPGEAETAVGQAGAGTGSGAIAPASAVVVKGNDRVKSIRA